jgi:hypothetical protein
MKTKLATSLLAMALCMPLTGLTADVSGSDMPEILGALNPTTEIRILNDSELSEIRGMVDIRSQIMAYIQNLILSSYISGLSCSQCKDLLTQIFTAAAGFEPTPCPTCPPCSSSPLGDGLWYCTGGSCYPATSGAVYIVGEDNTAYMDQILDPDSVYIYYGFPSGFGPYN